MSTNVVSLKSGGGISAIVPQTIEEVFRLAQGIAASGLAPKGMDKPEQVTVAILTGLEIGLPPMFAIQKIAVINGRPSIWGDAVPALLWSRGFKVRERMEGEGDTRTAVCEVVRPDGEKVERSFTVAMARKAGLWGKAGPWTQHPDRMLQMRARSFACRDGAADALSGLYLREEIDEPMRDITPARTMLEVPDEIPVNSGTQTAQNGTQPADLAPSEPDKEPDETLLDAAGFLAKLSEDIALCSSTEELSEVAEQYADMIDRLPKSDKAKARKMLKEAAE